jgi:hypothetical protein
MTRMMGLSIMVACFVGYPSNISAQAGARGPVIDELLDGVIKPITRFPLTECQFASIEITNEGELERRLQEFQGTMHGAIFRQTKPLVAAQGGRIVLILGKSGVPDSGESGTTVKSLVPGAIRQSLIIRGGDGGSGLTSKQGGKGGDVQVEIKELGFIWARGGLGGGGGAPPAGEASPGGDGGDAGGVCIKSHDCTFVDIKGGSGGSAIAPNGKGGAGGSVQVIAVVVPPPPHFDRIVGSAQGGGGGSGGCSECEGGPGGTADVGQTGVSGLPGLNGQGTDPTRSALPAPCF